TDDSGRFCTKLLTELGADVVRVSIAGSPGHPMKDSAAASRGGVLDWWYDGGKRRHSLDLSVDRDRASYRELAARAHIVIETMRPGTLSDYGIDHADLLTSNPSLVQISITPFGRTGPRAQWATSDLVSAAMGGFLALTGLLDRPLNPWGRQACNYAGFVGAICALTGVRAAQRDGRGRHVDVSIHEALTGSIENLFFQWFFDDVVPLPKLALRQGALHWLHAYDLAACRGGYTMITPTPGVAKLFAWMAEDGVVEAKQWLDMDLATAVQNMDDIMAATRRWVADKNVDTLWWQAQEQHIAFGGVQNIEQVAHNPQFEYRKFFVPTAWEGTRVLQPRGMVQFSDTPSVLPRAPTTQQTPLDVLLRDWGVLKVHSSGSEVPTDRPLEGLRIADFTWVLAGPFATRMLGDLGADVVRVQTEERATSVNAPDHPFTFVWGRSKRNVSLNMKHPQALATVRKFIERSDVLMENFAAGVLASWGLDWDTLHAWNPRLIYITMAGCGQEGPWKKVLSYAPTIHALSGITHLTNFADRGDVGCGFSLNDHLAGFSAATAVLAALHARERTGRGQRIDLAQLETGTYCIGPALLDYLANEHLAQPAGNTDGLHDHVPNNVYPCADGFIAISVTCESQWQGLVRVVDADELNAVELKVELARRGQRANIDNVLRRWSANRRVDDVMTLLQNHGVPAGKVQNAQHLAEQDEQHVHRNFWRKVKHEFFGDRVADTFPALWDGQRPVSPYLSPAFVGQHNFDLWGELAGLGPEEIANGMADNLFG
ncbi:MAG: CoA transferase, partial [Proteobacteria bacterium]|nr:CoA transferase [Pseudomonadota bacterium]